MSEGGATPAGPGREGRRRRPWLLAVEVAWFVLVTVTIAVTSVARPFFPGGSWVLWTVMFAAGVAALVATAVRWWRPGAAGPTAFVVVLAGLVVDATFPSGSLAPLRLILSAAAEPVLLAATTRRAHPALAALVVGGGAATAAVDVVRRGNTLSVRAAREFLTAAPSYPFVLTMAAFLVLAPTAIGLLLRSYDASRRAESFARVRAEERLQVARELHDLVANHVTGIVVAAQAATLDPGLSAPAGRSLAAIEDAGNEALDAMRRMVGALRSRPRGAEGAGSPGAADELWELPTAATTPLAAVRAAIGDDDVVRLRVGEGLADDDPGRTVAADVVTTVHRILVESLTNARRHMPDRSWIDVEVSLPHSSVLVLEVRNERGRGTRRTHGGGHGLVGLAERASAVGGRLEAGPVGGHGWRVRAEIPCGSRRRDREAVTGPA